MWNKEKKGAWVIRKIWMPGTRHGICSMRRWHRRWAWNLATGRQKTWTAWEDFKSILAFFNISVDWWFYGIIFSDRLGIIIDPAHAVHHQATSLCSRKLPTWPSAMRLRPSKVTGQLEDAAMKLKRPCLRACGVCVSFKQNSRIIQILQGGHDPCSRQYGNVWKPFRKLVLLSLNLNAIQKRWRLPSGKLA